MSERVWRWIAVAAAFGVLAAVTLIPAIDLGVSAAFYVPGQGFPWRATPVGGFVRHHVPDILIATLAVCICLWLMGVWRHRAVLGLSMQKIAYLAATLIVGPGLIVESILKPHSGRARPQDLAMFGGGADYTPPLSPADACTANCSFVSGHAAVAFWITAYAFIMPPALRLPVFALGIVVGLAVGAVRVMQGAHFVSDVVYAGALVIIVNLLLARCMFGPRDRADGPPAV